MLGRRREDLPVDIETGANGLCAIATPFGLYMKVTLTVNRCGTKGLARW
jgi:hypothetical protein